MEDRHDESQSPAPGSQEARAAEAAVTSAASASNSGAVSEETLAYLRKRAQDAAQADDANEGDAKENDAKEGDAEDKGGEAAADESLPSAERTFVLGPMTLGSLGEWQRLEARVRGALDGEANDKGKPVVLECASLSTLDSIGLGRLVVLHDLVRERGGGLALLAVPDEVRSKLVAMGLHELLPCYQDQEALANGKPLPPPAEAQGNGANEEPSTASAPESPPKADEATPPTQDKQPQSASDGATEQTPETAATTETKEEPQAGPPSQESPEFPIQPIVDAVRVDLRTMYDALVGEMRNRFREVEQVRTNFQNLGKALNQVQGFLGEVATRLTAFEQHLNRLTGYFNQRFRADKQNQNAFDRLHEELKFYRDDALFRSQKPVYMDLILLYDDVGRMLRDERDEDAANKFALLREVILEILYRRDVEVIEDRPTEFDKSFQKALKRILTEDPSLDRTVAEYVRDGFRWGESILRPQEVVVRRYEGDDSGSTTTATHANDARASDTDHPGDEPTEATAPQDTAADDTTSEPEPKADGTSTWQVSGEEQPPEEETESEQQQEEAAPDENEEASPSKDEEESR